MHTNITLWKGPFSMDYLTCELLLKKNLFLIVVLYFFLSKGCDYCGMSVECYLYVKEGDRL